jgi:type II secretory pathway pseudopilin PulG
VRIRVRARRGISLLEAVAAIAIVGMTSVAALEAAGGEMRTAERARRAIEVEELATSRLEFMDLLNDTELQSLPDSVAKGKFPAPFDGYTWITTSTPISDPNGLYDIHITVSWANGSYLIRTYRYITPRLATRQ